MDLTKDQKQALQDLFLWWKKPKKQYVSLGGYAGTGKTTLIGLLRKKIFKKDPKKKVAFASFTGKARNVLEQSLIKQKAIAKEDKVSTIHGLIYEAICDDKDRVVGWKKRDKLKYDLIIVDEGSMVSKEIWLDLLSFDLPIIVVGDHGQLPPIKGKFNLMEKPDLILTQIHRQAEGSPIIQVSKLVRERGFIPKGNFGQGVVKHDRKNSEIFSVMQELKNNWNEESLFLVGINRTRVKLNDEIRNNLERFSQSPVTGERVICLKNNWETGIYNGMLGKVSDIEEKGKHWYLAEIEMDDGLFYKDKISRHQFGKDKTIDEVKGLHWRQMGDLFDFGYVLTVHKAQGSQAPRVVVLEERTRYMNDEDWRRWLYTAVTRAEKELVVIGD